MSDAKRSHTFDAMAKRSKAKRTSTDVMAESLVDLSEAVRDIGDTLQKFQEQQARADAKRTRIDEMADSLVNLSETMDEIRITLHKFQEQQARASDMESPELAEFMLALQPIYDEFWPHATEGGLFTDNGMVGVVFLSITDETLLAETRRQFCDFVHFARSKIEFGKFQIRMLVR